MNSFKLILNYFIILFFFPSCISYLWHVSKEQTTIILSRESIDSVIASDSSDENTRKKLNIIKTAREFAIKELFLNPKGGFEYFTKLNREEVGWNLSASYPFKFESYTWWFPIAGRVPYKGFFDLEKARDEEQSLIEKGFDTRVRITAGYSTLGWFSDPVLSPQLRLREDELVALVFHEMSHATVYFEGDSIFNESYASFVEEEGTKKFYESLGEEISIPILQSRARIKLENKIILTEIKSTAEKLKSIYESAISDEEKKTEKEKIIEEYREKILEFGKGFVKFDPERIKKAKINNENFIGALRYHSGEKFFQDKFLECNGDFQKFHEEMKKLKKLSYKERQGLLKK